MVLGLCICTNTYLQKTIHHKSAEEKETFVILIKSTLSRSGYKLALCTSVCNKHSNLSNPPVKQVLCLYHYVSKVIASSLAEPRVKLLILESIILVYLLESKF